jgi:hypothetical protein
LGAIPALLLLAQFVAGIVYLVFMGIGVTHIHGLSTGAAAGVAVISGVAAVVLWIIFVVMIGVLFAAILVGMRGAAH